MPGVTVISFELTIYRRGVNDPYHPGRYWAEVRRADTDDVVHTTEERLTQRQASEVAEAWVISQGGVIVNRP